MNLEEQFGKEIIHKQTKKIYNVMRRLHPRTLKATYYLFCKTDASFIENPNLNDYEPYTKSP